MCNKCPICWRQRIISIGEDDLQKSSSELCKMSQYNMKILNVRNVVTAFHGNKSITPNVVLNNTPLEQVNKVNIFKF
jgi:hypothetical protein